MLNYRIWPEDFTYIILKPEDSEIAVVMGDFFLKLPLFAPS